MIIRPGDVEAAIREVPETGFARVQDCFLPDGLLEERIHPRAANVWDEGWTGDSRLGGPIDVEEDLQPHTQAFAEELGKLASAAGFRRWRVNRFVETVTTEGTKWHADRASFTDFVALAYTSGRTDMFVETKDDRVKGLILNPGDLLFVAAGTRHGVKPGTHRSFKGFAHESYTEDPSVTSATY